MKINSQDNRVRASVNPTNRIIFGFLLSPKMEARDSSGRFSLYDYSTHMKFINVSFDVVLEGNMGEKEGKTINAKLREIIRKELDLEGGE